MLSINRSIQNNNIEVQSPKKGDNVESQNIEPEVMDTMNIIGIPLDEHVETQRSKTGMASVIVGHPFDTIKIRLQTQDSLRPRYHGMVHCCTSIIRQESVVGLFKGMSTPIISIGCLMAIVFGCHGYCLRRLDERKLSHHLYSGMIAGFVQSFLACPIELSKICLQVQGIGQRNGFSSVKHYSNSVDAIVKIFKSDGLVGCSRGLGMTIVRDIPGFGLYFLVFEAVCRHFMKSTEEGEQLGATPLILAGGLGGVANWAIIYPFDVIKSRFQTDGIAGVQKYTSYIHLVKTSYRQEGLKVFSRGLGVTLIRSFPACATLFTVATFTKRVLH